MGIVGVIVAIRAVACSVLATALFGAEGGIVTAILAVIAIMLGILKRRKDKKGGIAAIVIAVLALVMAFGLTNFWAGTYRTMHEKALELKPDGLWAKASEETNHGIMGIIKNLPQDEASLNALVDEMNEMNKAIETK